MTKQTVYFLMALALVTLHAGLVPAEGRVLFADRSLAELTLMAADPQAGQFTLMDSEGHVQDGALADYIGIQLARVTAIRDIAVEVTIEEDYDWYGTTRTRTLTQVIPLAQALEGGKGVQ